MSNFLVGFYFSICFAMERKTFINLPLRSSNMLKLYVILKSSLNATSPSCATMSPFLKSILSMLSIKCLCAHIAFTWSNWMLDFSFSIRSTIASSIAFWHGGSVFGQNHGKCANLFSHLHLLRCCARSCRECPCGRVYLSLPANSIRCRASCPGTSAGQKPCTETDQNM